MAVPELDYITVKGFKSIASIEKLPLRSINVLIGPNGSGKSNFIGVFAFLHEIREGRLQDYVGRAGGADKLLYFGSKETEEIYLHISFEGEVNQYAITLAHTTADGLYPKRELAYFWNKDTHPEGPLGNILPSRNGEAGISETNVSAVPDWVRDRLGRWRVYHFHDTSNTSPMKKAADLEDNRFLRSDGSNLASFLYFLREKQAASYNLIRKTVQRVTPFFHDFVLEPRQLKQDQILLAWRHKHSDKYFDAASLSDGTLRFIALATLFLQPKSHRPSVILVDEPELGLHPYAISVLGSLIKSAGTKTQILVSTQSPLLLDEFEPEDVLVADLVDGTTHLKRLESEKLTSWLEDYSLGQLWEKNKLGGRP
ncbi:MAG TPA: AAA family ATPase [Pyrinomonadaceae bacterium]|nr:AAA family ATPase [Pyrinomonadaceae bacterium]